MLTKTKEFVNKYRSDILLVIFVILISLLSFALGFITAKYQAKESIIIKESKDVL